MLIFDTHCHYNLEPLYSGDTTDPWLSRFKLPVEYPSWQAHWQTAQERGVSKSAVIGTDLESSQRAIAIAQTDENLYATVGLHPGHVEELMASLDKAVVELAQLITPAVVAIGETGLDYFRLPDGQLAEEIKTLQKKVLIAQIELANTHRLPLILHLRDQTTPEAPTPGNAYWDVLDIIQKHYQWHRPAVLHCVSGPLAYVQAMVELGAYIGIAGNVTYPKSDHIRRIVMHTPSDKLLLETDAPFLPPVPHRGTVCEPWMITHTAEFLHTELKIKPVQIWENSLAFFNTRNA